MAQANDLLLMGRLQSGDRKAFAELYDRHGALMYGVALRILRNRPDAEDAVQEAWVQIWNRCDSYDPARGSVAAWLVTIARSRALDRLRQHSARDRGEAGAFSSPLPATADPEETTAHGKLQNELGRALAALDPRQRQVLEIACFEGLSQSRIAARLGAPLGSVKFWARQGLLRLRELVPRDVW